VHAASYTTNAGERSAYAYHELKQRLLAGEYPLGRRLAEEALAVSLGVSRTPVREALSRLHAETLVSRHPGGGYEPAAPDLHTARELYEVRFALELDALERPRRLGQTHDEDVLVELRGDWQELRETTPDRAACDRPDSPEAFDPDFVLLDEDFHVRLAQAAGNAALVEMLIRVNERIRPVRMHDFLSADRITLTVHQHLAVVDAVVVGDLEQARVLLTRHFDESLAIAESRAAQSLARMLTHQRGAGR
jgi:DNA-binding GntR family transcriptional regulator